MESMESYSPSSDNEENNGKLPAALEKLFFGFHFDFYSCFELFWNLCCLDFLYQWICHQVLHFSGK